MNPAGSNDTSAAAATANPTLVSGRMLLAAWIVLLVASGLSFWRAVSQSGLVIGSIFVLLATFLGMVSVFAPIYYVAVHCRELLNGHPLRASWWHFGVSLGAALFGLAVAAVGVATETQWAVAAGALVFVHGGALLSDWANQRIAPSSGSPGSGALLAGATLGLVFATICTANQGEFNQTAAIATGGALLMLVIIKLAVVQYVEKEVREETQALENQSLEDFERPTEPSPSLSVSRRRTIVWAASVAAIVLGAIAAWLNGWAGTIWAGSLLIGGLSVLGLLFHNEVPLPGRPADDTSSLKRWWVYLAGAAGFGGICLAWLTSLSGSFWAALGVTVVILLVGAFFVLPGETVFGAFLIGLLAIWIAEDTDAAKPADDNAAIVAGSSTEGWIVALGDSYISGEGAPDFYSQTNTPEANTCRRAPTAYPVLVSQALGMRVESFACSGAKTGELIQSGEGQMEISPDGIYGDEPQFTALTTWLGSDVEPDVDLVLLSIGGNDSGFTDVITSCLLPGASCADVERAFLDRVEDLDKDLAKTYEELGEILSDAAFEGGVPPILVTQYPDPIGDGPAFLDKCNLMLSSKETPFIRRFRDNLNAEVATAVAATRAAGLDITLVQSGTALDGHELCEDDAYINWLRLSPPDGGFLATLNPITWKNGSLHPGPDGHCITAQFVIEEAAGAGFATPGARPSCDTPTDTTAEVSGISDMAIAELPEICDGLDDQPAECTKTWLADAKSGAGADAVGVVALGVAAGMFLGAVLSTLEQPHDPRPVPGFGPRLFWVFPRKVWLEYDKVANGRRAEEKADPNAHVAPSTDGAGTPAA